MTTTDHTADDAEGIDLDGVSAGDLVREHGGASAAFAAVANAIGADVDIEDLRRAIDCRLDEGLEFPEAEEEARGELGLWWLPDSSMLSSIAHGYVD